MLRALLLHGKDLRNATACFAWCLNFSLHLRSLVETKISHRFGLLENNLGASLIVSRIASLIASLIGSLIDCLTH